MTHTATYYLWFFFLVALIVILLHWGGTMLPFIKGLTGF